LDEKHPLNPINYYGVTKKIGEELIKIYSEKGLNYVILRYFNVIGDAGLNYIDSHPENVVPILMECVFKKRSKFVIYGDNYDTLDKTCVRDYIDVNDLVDAHILALNMDQSHIINLGTSKGASVKELVNLVKEISNVDFDVQIGNFRIGDPAILIAGNKKAKEILGWTSNISIENSIKSSYEAYKNYFNF
jgi:UDP-glucose 4-epimerase